MILNFFEESLIEPEAGEELAGAFSIIGVDVELDDLGVDFLLIFGDVELAGGDEVKLNIFHFKVLVEEFRQGIVAGECGMHSHEPSEGDSKVHVHGMEVDPIVVVLQPVKQFLVELELLEAGSGFKDEEKGQTVSSR
jgi:hypothetical protein